MKSTPKLIVFHPSFYKPNTTTPTPTPRLYLLAFFSLFTLTFLLTLLKPTSSPQPPTPTTTTPLLSPTVSAALLHYATTPTTTPRMSPSELTTISTTLLHHCHPNCNLLVFGFSHESLLWHSLNSPSPSPQRRTVFLDENQYLVSSYERNFTDIEAYDVDYTTKVTQSEQLINYARAHRTSHCKPVQNLLFSDCKLAVNDLPNHLYSIPWDVIIVDGPRGYSGKTPGRMSAIFTSAVFARTPITPTSSAAARRRTHVFVHDYGREVEKMYSQEFLCNENLIEVKDDLAHFVVKERDLEDDLEFRFCTGEDLSSSLS